MATSNYKEASGMETGEIKASVEAILFVAGDAVERRDIATALDITDAELEAGVAALQAEYDSGRRGLRLMRFEKKLQLATRSQYTPYVERVLTPLKRQTLTQSAMETLAVVAYRQPCTRVDIESIRGVRCEYAVSTLVAHGLIREVGRKDVVGRPILYGTTEEFLRHFGLSDLSELPALFADAAIEMQMELSVRDDAEETNDLPETQGNFDESAGEPAT
jgi:segregation and condensation protein B